MIRVVMFSAIFFSAASVPATATETGNDGGRLVIGQGANSCWAWTRSHEAKTATQGLYTPVPAQEIAGALHMGPVAQLECRVKMLVRTGLDQIDRVVVHSASKERKVVAHPV